MDLSTLEQLKDLSKRLQQRGFSWHHDDYFCLKEALPELIERHLSEASTRPDNAISEGLLEHQESCVNHIDIELKKPGG